MLLRWLPVLALGWLAFLFGRTLRRGRVPLIEQIARVGDPQMPEPLRRYTRWLTVVWVAYFLLAAVVIIIAPSGAALPGLWVAVGTVVLFVGERVIRPRLFPGRAFPGLLQQVRDTWSVWHPRRIRRD